MRPLVFTLGIALALPLMSAEAGATTHSCDQLRATVQLGVPLNVRNLPYHLLDCGGISEIHLLNVQYRTNDGERSRRIQAVFRRYGLIQ